jgi:hypothetical protein
MARCVAGLSCSVVCSFLSQTFSDEGVPNNQTTVKVRPHSLISVFVVKRCIFVPLVAFCLLLKFISSGQGRFLWQGSQRLRLNIYDLWLCCCDPSRHICKFTFVI